jgi:hypothetical protein
MNAPATDERTRDELYAKAQELDIEGRSDMNRDALLAAVTEAEGSASGSASATPGPLRPAQEATNSKLAPVPPVADQPGLGRAANPDPAPGQSPNLDVGRVGAAKERARANAQAHREAQG